MNRRPRFSRRMKSPPTPRYPKSKGCYCRPPYCWDQYYWPDWYWYDEEDYKDDWLDDEYYDDEYYYDASKKAYERGYKRGLSHGMRRVRIENETSTDNTEK